MYYFAYGSNMNQKQMLERCPDSKPKCTATLHHYKLIFSGWNRQWRGGIASIRPFRGERVPGSIYDVSERDLRRLDKYEESYSRMKVTVITDDGDALEALTYIRNRQSEETQPSADYIAVLQQGYRDWGII